MKLRDFKILADENLHPEVVAYLRQLGHDVKDVREAGLAGSLDEEILSFAHAEGRLVLTHDSDFGTIVFTQLADFLGIIYLRPGHISPAFTIASIDTLLDLDINLERRSIVVVEHKEDSIKIRIREL